MDRPLLMYYLAQHDISPIELENDIGWSPGTRLARITHGRGWKVDELLTLMRLGLTEEEIGNVFFKEVRK